MKKVIGFIGEYVNFARIKRILKRKVVAFLLVVLVAGTSVDDVKVLAKDIAVTILQIELGELLEPTEVSEPVLEAGVIAPVLG